MDEFLTYGFYVEKFCRVLTARQMRNRKVIRWIKNRLARLGIPYTQMEAYFLDYLRDTNRIHIRRRSRDGKWVEAVFPTDKAFECDPHWWEDVAKEVPMNRLPRLPRPQARMRMWIIGSLLRSMDQ